MIFLCVSIFSGEIQLFDHDCCFLATVSVPLTDCHFIWTLFSDLDAHASCARIFCPRILVVT
jgi:hypothetical protein